MSESSIDQHAVADALKRVIEPNSGRDLPSLGWVRQVSAGDASMHIALLLPPAVANDSLKQQLTEQIRQHVGKVPGVSRVDVDIAVAQETTANAMREVKQVIAVGAGKGGVGKSTVSTLLAVGLQKLGYKTGLLDADVYGPSIPKLTGTENAQPEIDDDGRIIPPMRDGMPILSMGYLVPADQAVIWRGPMAQKYVKEFLDRGMWGPLDFLIVDLPPGTGDIPLTLAQSIPLTGAVVVCTPQDVALVDAVKAVRMYHQLGVSTIGMIENMSYYVCPQCGHRDEMFGHGGCQRAAEDLNVPFLGGIPLNIDIRKFGDSGEPDECFRKPADYVVQALESCVKRMLEELERKTREDRPPPTLKVTG